MDFHLNQHYLFVFNIGSQYQPRHLTPGSGKFNDKINTIYGWRKTEDLRGMKYVFRSFLRTISGREVLSYAEI